MADDEMAALVKRLKRAVLYDGSGEESDLPDEAATAIALLRRPPSPPAPEGERVEAAARAIARRKYGRDDAISWSNVPAWKLHIVDAEAALAAADALSLAPPARAELAKRLRELARNITACHAAGYHAIVNAADADSLLTEAAAALSPLPQEGT